MQSVKILMKRSLQTTEVELMVDFNSRILILQSSAERNGPRVLGPHAR